MRDNVISRLRTDVLAAFPKVVDELVDELGPHRRELLARSRQRLEAGTCHVVVVGEYKRGKSSLLNALVERPGLFPVDVDVATCVVSTLAWGAEEHAVVHLAEPGSGGAVRQLEVTLAELPAYATEQGNPGNHKNVRLVEIHAPVPQLEGGLVVVDTPGVGSVNGEHTAATRAFLERADGLVFVCDAIEPPATYELDFLSQALEKCEVVVTAVTKTDKVRDAGPVVEGAREKLAGRTGRQPENLVIVPVSSFRKLKWLRDRSDDQLLADSGFPELDRALWEGLAGTSSAVQLRRALDRLGDALTTAGSPLVNELAALDSDASHRRIRGQVEETTARLAQLSSAGASWRTELTRRFEVDTRQARAALQDAFDALLRRYQEKVSAGGDPGSDELISEVASGMHQALTEAHDRLAGVALQIMEDFARLTSLRLTSPEAPAPPFTPSITPPTVPLNVRPARTFDQLRAGWSTAAAGVGAGAGVALFEPFSGTIMATGLGVMGLIQGVRNHRMDLRERAERERDARLLQLVCQEIAANRRHASESFQQAYGDTAQSMVKELNAQLAAQQESLAESGRRLQETSRQTKETQMRRRGELLARQERYRRLQGELDRLRSRVDRLATRSAPPETSTGVRPGPAAPVPRPASPHAAPPSATPTHGRRGHGVSSAAAAATVAAVAGEVAADLALNAALHAFGPDAPAAAALAVPVQGATDVSGVDALPESALALPEPPVIDISEPPVIGASFDPDQFDTP
ncbi:dynamin family protein [Streptomyces sp. GQFP]|uniref:dynamin family protein n=1 Tax=Streptomyces sp. GQFP TaxID=2907545 RepID=UPI001F41B945|nr:dynamin family protein [Streptomyces sp. GQFP]UIX35027.1 dynamin family protein [Streptomyces sp. GQFP]